MTPRRTFLVATSIVAFALVGLLVRASPVLRAGGRPAPIGMPVEIRSPLGLPPLPIPPDNPPTAETIALGRRLFHDPRLSVDNTVSCASCHKPALAFSDGRQLAEGVRLFVKDLYALRALMRNILARADAALVVSRATRRRLLPVS